MTTAQEVFDALVARISETIPGFQIRYKTESRSQRILGVLIWIFNRTYMTRFTTTLYPHVYFPTRDFVTSNPQRAWEILAHEYVHLFDNKRKPLHFRFMYLFPQILGLLAFGAFAAFFTPWALLFLVALVALAPWPAPGRTDAELRGYLMSVAVQYWPTRPQIPDEMREWVVSNFTGWAYYKMCPNKLKVRAILDRMILRLESDDIFLDDGAEPYIHVFDLLKDKGLIRAGVSIHA